MTSYSNCYILVSNVYYYPTCQSIEQRPYIGADSYWLSRIIVNRVYGNVLDLCTGSGIQAIIAAKTADKVVAIDIDSESTRIATFNVYLNGVSDKVDVITGDLYKALESREQFDFIISNPPFIPIPTTIDFHVCGDGGEDGTEVIRRIISGYKQYLKPFGETIMIGQCMGSYEYSLIEHVVKELISDNQYSIILNGKNIIENQALGFSELASRYNEKPIKPDAWLKIYDKMQMNYLHNFTLFTYGQTGHGKIINIKDTWAKETIPVRNFSTIVELTKSYCVNSSDKHQWVVDEETAVFLNLIDGKTPLEDLVKKMPLKYKLRYGNNHAILLQVKFCSLCSLLERQRIIEKANFR